jgi:hypothetical protein
MTIVGALSFGDFIFDYWNAAGLAVSFAGAVWYAMRSALRVSGRCACMPARAAEADGSRED